MDAIEGMKEYWAPEIVERDGKFYLHYASGRRGQGRPVPNNRHSKKGLADSILGFSKFQPTLLSDTPTLTPLPKTLQKNS